LQHNITHLALGDLLKLIRGWYPDQDFPVDPRTLLKTPRNVVTEEIAGGTFYYFGVARKILETDLDFRKKTSTLASFTGYQNLVILSIGIDGLPISKSSNLQFWPILGLIDQAVNSNPFPIAIYYGESKPNSIQDYLKSFVEEMSTLETEGLLKNNIQLNVRIRCIIADAPARSFIKSVKNHNAYYGCERCYCRGFWSRRVLYGNDLYDAYNDNTFRRQVYSKHHEGESPLANLKLGLISQIPLDYMHLVCLGVMKKLLLTWTFGKQKLSPSCIHEISKKMIACKYYVTNEFARKPRSLKDLRLSKPPNSVCSFCI